jgi:uncharacterized membrane protein
MAEFLATPLASMIVLVAIGVVLAAVGFYVIGRVRSGMRRTDPQTSEWLTKFEELKAKGDLSDEEYRTIKAMLAERFQQELKGTDQQA